MRRIGLLFAALLLLVGCGKKMEGEEDRAEALQRKYALQEGFATRFRVRVDQGEETASYLLDAEGEEGETRLTLIEPAELAGITATVSSDDDLTLRYDGMVLDAGGAGGQVSAVNALSVLLRAAAEGWITERSIEAYGGQPALRLCFRTAAGGRELLVTAFFDDADAPLYAELEQDGEVLAYLEFTNFAFRDTMTQTEEGGISDGNTTQANLGGN